MNDEPPQGSDWYPVGFDPAAQALTWLQLPGERFTAPFFEDTLRNHRRQSMRAITSLAALERVSAGDPSAFFFHASRCGSTLMMQLLGCVDGCRALSEPAVLDAILHEPQASDAALHGLVHALGRTDREPHRYFLKPDCWHLPHLERLRRIFPAVPCFFIYREPAAILRSHRRERGSQMVPGMMDSLRFGIDPASVDPADLDGYATRVLAAVFRQAVEAAEAGRVIPIAHSQLPGLIWEKLGPALGLPVDGWEQAKSRARYDAKQPHQAHLENVVPANAALVSRALAGDFIRLETLREIAQRDYFARP